MRSFIIFLLVLITIFAANLVIKSNDTKEIFKKKINIIELIDNDKISKEIDTENNTFFQPIVMC